MPATFTFAYRTSIQCNVRLPRTGSIENYVIVYLETVFRMFGIDRLSQARTSNSRKNSCPLCIYLQATMFPLFSQKGQKLPPTWPPHWSKVLLMEKYLKLQTNQRVQFGRIITLRVPHKCRFLSLSLQNRSQRPLSQHYL